ncbi:3-octaprenyl-4-hydroxybenzoate carboxy-lyase, partial [Escherichia coli]
MFCCRSGHIEWTDLQLRIKTCKVSPEASKGEKMKRLTVG